jgi:hypothetical protein
LPHCLGVPGSRLLESDGQSIEYQTFYDTAPIERVWIGQPVVGERSQGDRRVERQPPEYGHRLADPVTVENLAMFSAPDPDLAEHIHPTSHPSGACEQRHTLRLLGAPGPQMGTALPLLVANGPPVTERAGNRFDYYA